MPEVNIIVRAKDEASRTLQGIGGNLGQLGLGMVSFGAVGAAALASVGAAAGKLAYDAAMIEPVQITFDNLTESIGSTAESMLDKLRPATMGVLRDVDLMKAANKLMAMGLADSEEQAAKLANMAITLGTAMGVDATTSLENFTLMLANQSIPRLDTFGISSGKVRQRIEELQAANENMTRETAFMIATMELGEEAMSRVGDVSETGAVKIAGFRASLGNLKDTAGEALLPVLHAVLDRALTPLLDKVVEMIPVIQTGLSNAWATVQPVISTIAGVFQNVAAVVLPALREAFSVSWAIIQSVIQAAWEAAQPYLAEMKAAINEFWQEMLPRLQEAWQNVWGWIQGTFVPWLQGTLIPLLREWWDRLEPVRAIVIELAAAIARFMGSAAVMALKGFLMGIIGTFDLMASAIGSVISAIQTLIDWIQRAIDWWHRLGSATGEGGGVPSSGPVGGMHQMGLAYVPTSPYYAALHRGEAVLTKEQAEQWRMGQEVHFHFGDSFGIDGVNEAIERAIEEKRRYST